MTPANSNRPHRDPPLCPTDEDSIIPKKEDRSEVRYVNRRSNEYIIKSGIAGGLAGCAAKTMVGPLDRVKILFQASNPHFAKYTGSWSGVAIAVRDIYKQDGSRGLFKGHSATLLRIFPYAGIKFLSYEQIRNIFIPNKDYETPGRRFLSGSLAGCISVFFTYPLEVIRVRLAFETRREGRSTLTSICRKIYNEHPPPTGPQQIKLNATKPVSSTISATSATIQQVTPHSGIANFFRGFTPTMVGMLPYAGSSFLAHDTVSDFFRAPAIAEWTTLEETRGGSSDRYKPSQLTWWAELMSGALAGLTSQTVSYPFEVVRRRMQVGGVVGDGHRLGMAEIGRRIWMERGWRGFFVGLGIGYIKVIPMTATSFYVYERGKYYMGI
ncbi:mitochondrial carrier [Pseudovirgaria hyperparasitica]|uniref:Mitochondrial thiamine pyrophosphate carrier 1 n=1 Tax=Pseudovirgaria hyperparasitica TaxID=470096 RepID=A0A6A6WG58_9PEZI|nr:mitochondrial carrier [Pseudovirgaria hyperparasitica]KAF2761778.1 mitochondrial carrier [Pseudovirgaria hyperparasitica]